MVVHTCNPTQHVGGWSRKFTSSRPAWERRCSKNIFCSVVPWLEGLLSMLDIVGSISSTTYIHTYNCIYVCMCTQDPLNPASLTSSQILERQDNLCLCFFRINPRSFQISYRWKFFNKKPTIKKSLTNFYAFCLWVFFLKTHGKCLNDRKHGLESLCACAGPGDSRSQVLTN